MKTITHREMRNNSADVLRRVAAGESFQITNNGRVTAVLSPVERPLLDELIERNQARPALKPLSSLCKITPKDYPISSRELLDESRGRW
ncbi:type II toxin-antitoxin system Phd/YefM family antitoxin [Leifsonia sp. RAF41]|uniref:type II toxin-antitoxin system Phd/YefM family antitoxin n=1 Tax=Leifsonia sp. RAF41 TaxID=3233056 RepID=UPI003F9E015E